MKNLLKKSTGLTEEDLTSYETRSSRTKTGVKAFAKKIAIGIGGVVIGIAGTLAYQYISGNEVGDLGEEEAAEEKTEEEVA